MKLYYNEAELKKALEGSQTLVTRDGKEYILIDGMATELKEFLNSYHNTLKMSQEANSKAWKKESELAAAEAANRNLQNQVDALKARIANLENAQEPRCEAL